MIFRFHGCEKYLKYSRRSEYQGATISDVNSMKLGKKINTMHQNFSDDIGYLSSFYYNHSRLLIKGGCLNGAL